MGRLAVGNRDQAKPRSGGGQQGHRPADAQNLVVRVSGHDHDTRPGAQAGEVQMPQLQP